MESRGVELLIGAACVAFILWVGVAVAQKVDVTCWKIPYITSGCTASTK